MYGQVAFTSVNSVGWLNEETTVFHRDSEKIRV